MLYVAACRDHHLQNLNNVSAYDAGQQWGLNQAMSTRLGITTSKGLSTKGVVTPQITGLFNVSALGQFISCPACIELSFLQSSS
jgi:hypothetical protein